MWRKPSSNYLTGQIQGKQTILEVFKCEESVSVAHYFPHDVKLRLLPDSRSFLANQKARNAIVGAENLLNLNILNNLRSIQPQRKVLQHQVRKQQLFHLIRGQLTEWNRRRSITEFNYLFLLFSIIHTFSPLLSYIGEEESTAAPGEETSAVPSGKRTTNRME